METSFSLDHCASVLRFLADGGTIDNYATKVGVSRFTIYFWARRHPEFKKAVVDGLAQRPKRRPPNYEHGLRKRLEFGVWAAMRRRCNNPNVKDYPDYGGRGITVCERWAKFINFWNDMGPCPEGLELDRKDNDGNYEPGNCHWAPRSVQAKNKRNNRLLTAHGQTKILADWARELNMTHGAIHYRLRTGWSVERALSLPKTARGGG